MKTMDILLCSGNSYLSRKIKWFNKLIGIKGEAAKLTHVVLISCRHDFFVDVFESTTLNKWCGKRGVQTNPFRLWLKEYNGKVWLRRTEFKRTELFKTIFRNFRIKHLGDNYENGIPGLLELLACGLRINVASNLKNVHCSELCVAAFQAMNIMYEFEDNIQLLPNNFPPYTFYEGGDFEKHLKCKIGKMERIK